MRATVKAIDLNTRTVTLMGPQGETTMKVGDQVQNLAQVKPGDTIVARYYESVAYVVAPPGTKLPEDALAVAAARAAPGQMPAGGVAEKIVVTGLVVGVNPAAHTLSLVDPAGGEIRTIVVKDPQYQQMMSSIKVGDTITAVNGEQLDEPDDLTRLLADDSPGDEVTITVEPPTRSQPRDVELALGADPDDPARAIIGIEVTGRGIDFDFPVDVTIDTGDVGGPSAGLAFTLAIIDDLTPGDLTGGEDVAVTGTINSDGTVGPVGGTGQKAAAVRAQGYDAFLVPSADYEAARQHAGDVDVIAVDTLDEALAALADLGGNVDDLPQPAASQG